MKRHFKKKRSDEYSKRITIILIVIFLLSGAIVWRLFDLQVLKHFWYKSLASNMHDFYQDVLPARGEIFVANHSSVLENNKNKDYPVATNIDLSLAYAVPDQVDNPQETAEKLAPILEMDIETLLFRLNKENDLYEPLKHYLSDEKVEEIEKLNLPGIKFLPETKRYYPEANLFSQILGFVGFDGDKILGRYGIEEKYESEIAGKSGIIETGRDGQGQLIALPQQALKEVQHGADIVLTLDYPIQYFVCEKLKEAVKQFGAEGGTAIVMEPSTGKILAMCGEPNFNPNEYNKVENINVFLNPAISEVFEPGSVFKAITMAIGLDTNQVTPETTYEDTGEVKYGGYTIKNSDSKAHGRTTMTGVLEKSLNTGAVFVAKKVGQENFRKYLEIFGFDQITGIELPHEVSGNISSLKEKNEIYLATASFGQGISVTPLQMINAFSAIANQGKLMQPYIVDKIIYPAGQEIVTQPKFARQVISSAAANVLKGMLVSVVEHGYGRRAGVEGYYIAGKTGTAEVPDPQKGGYSNETIQTFIGFGPADDPRFVGLVKLDNPAIAWAESSSTPVFGQIAKFLLNYLQIPMAED